MTQYQNELGEESKIKAKEKTEEREAVESYKADESESIAKTSLGDLLKSKFTRKDSNE